MSIGLGRNSGEVSDWFPRDQYSRCPRRLGSSKECYSKRGAGATQQKAIIRSGLIQQVSRHRWRRGVFLILHSANIRAGAAVPAEVLTALKPADLSVEVIKQAEWRLSNSGAEKMVMTANTIHFFNPGRLGDRMSILWRRLFPSRDEMAYLYRIPPGSVVLYGYYLVRMMDLMRRYAVFAWRWWRGNRELTETLRQRDELREWLFKPDAK